MKKLLVALTLFLGCLGCQVEVSPEAPEDIISIRVNEPVEDKITGRIWVRAGSSDRPGVMRVFLADGTLLQDSCWETYRLSSWTMTSDSTLSWEEDTAEIEADVLAIDEQELVLRLNLVPGAEEQRFVPASVPYVCPDMPR